VNWCRHGRLLVGGQVREDAARRRAVPGVRTRPRRPGSGGTGERRAAGARKISSITASTAVAAGRGGEGGGACAPGGTVQYDIFFGGGRKYGIMKLVRFWRIGVCIAERIRRELALSLRNYSPQLSVPFVTVSTNAVVVSSITDNFCLCNGDVMLCCLRA